MMPLVRAGLLGRKDAAISVSTMPTSMNEGNRLSTLVSTSASTGCFWSRNRISSTSTVPSAPSSTAQKMPGLPSIQKKLMKSMPA